MDLSKYKIILGSIFVIVVSLAIVYSAPINEIIRTISILPAVGGMLAILFQLVRDDAAHQRKKELLQNEQMYNFSASSHIANTVFDKQVLFCEEYIRLVLESFKSLQGKKNWSEAHSFARDLTMLRLKNMCWLTAEIDRNLHAFEQKLRTVGAGSDYLSISKVNGGDEKHRDAVAREMLEIKSAFMDVLRVSGNQKEASLLTLSKNLRKIMGVEELAHHKNRIISAVDRK